MKKIVQKLRKKTPTAPERITNETVSEHRKRVLAGGRKFKYPIQYSRHKLVINTIIISVLAVILVAVFGWWQLYPQQNTSTFAYRFVSVIPLPVADVDGERVRYSDYLLRYRSSEYYLIEKEQVTLSGEDGERQRTYLKERSLRDAIADAYASKLARSEGVTVSDQEVSDAIQRQIEASDTTERTYYATIENYFGWDKNEHRHIMKAQLTKQKVAYKIDTVAKSTAEQVKTLATQAKEDDSWAKLVEDNKDTFGGATYGISGLVAKTNQDGGLAQAAAKLQKGGVSEIIETSTDDGYYYSIIRLVDSNETQVNYEVITIPLSEFQSKLDALYKDGRVNAYINVSLKEQE